MGNGCCSQMKEKPKGSAGDGRATGSTGADGVDASTEPKKDAHNNHLLERRFSDISALRQRENEINRLNPTDRMDFWREKLLMDIATDPFAVFRDFPRMQVSVTASETTTASRPTRPGQDAGGGRSSLPIAPDSRTGTTQKPNPLADPGSSGVAPRDAVHDTTDMFRERNARVLETVLQLAALCGEAQTFGVAFEEAWRCREEENTRAYNEEHAPHRQKQCRDGREGNGTAGAETSNEDAASTSQVQPQRSAPFPPSTTVRSGAYEVAEVLDVHHLLQYACVTSGMLVPTPTDSVATTDSTASALMLPEVEVSHTRSHPSSSVKRSRAGQVFDRSGPHVDQSHAPYGTGSSATARLRQTAPSLCTSGAMNASTYTVRSVTFHAMQFMVQGVMFFPMQRLKHVLWMPWASQYRDIDWRIFASAETISEAAYRDLCARRSKWQAAALRGAFPGAPPPDAILQEPGNVGLGGGGGGGGGAVTATGAGAAMAALHMASSLSHLSTPRHHSATLRSAGMSTSALSHRGGGLSRAFGAGGGASDSFSRPAGSSPGSEVANDNDPLPERRVLKVQHVQTIRNYVEEDQRRSIPATELQFSCTIVIDLPFTTRVIANQGANRARENSAVTYANSSSAVYDSAFRRASLMNGAQTPTAEHMRNDVHASGSGCPSYVPTALEEVLDLSLQVLSACVEAPKKKIFLISGDWKARRQEFAYVLCEQFDVDLVEVKELLKASAYA